MEVRGGSSLFEGRERELEKEDEFEGIIERNLVDDVDEVF